MQMRFKRDQNLCVNPIDGEGELCEERNLWSGGMDL